MATNDTPPRCDPKHTESISDSSHKLIDDPKTSVEEELLNDANTIDTVIKHSHELPRRPISPQRAAGVPKFGSWDAHDSYSGDGPDRFTCIFKKAREKSSGKATSGRGDSESPVGQTTISGNGSNESMHGGQDASDRSHEFTTGNNIYFDNLWREGSENDRSDPESIKKPGNPESAKQPGSIDTKRHRWYQWWRSKRPTVA
ncbi:hypothetical protein MKW92_022094 [Papaver armeniacum]|nr:hypothetical protein MKW92_022094 [Papaver armeniacum]